MDGAHEAAGGLSSSLILAIAALSGLATLGLEVVWTRMFSQVLQNSVYTFSIILTVFLAGLSLGSGLAHLLCRRVRSTRLTLALLIAVAGVLVSISPLVFQRFSEGLDYMKSSLGFWPYVGAVFAGTAVGIGPAVIVMGAVFPFLLKLSETHARSAGRTVGHLAAINTTAAIVGSLLAGFVLLRLLGVWGSVRSIALAYLLLSLGVWPWRTRAGRVLAALPAIALVVIALVDYGDYSRVWIEEEAGEVLVEAWDGPAGAVAVVRHDGDALRIRVNSSYNLGSSASAVTERLQGQMPLLLHPNPRSVFFLGMGTGITASGVMDFDVERVVICEVNPDVIRASRSYFSPWLNGLLVDPRVTVLPEDGRTWLAATRQRFDVVIADLFLRFKAGVGSLYTLEHFEAVREHLEPGGMFVQWLPMFDLSSPEFDILTKTMLEVFPQVTLWRRSLSPRYPVFALVGSLDDEPLDPAVFEQRVDALRQRGSLDPNTWLLNIPYAAYVSNPSAMEGRFRDAPLNTDDRTVLEYVAPITERNSRGSRETVVLAYAPLLQFCEGLIEELPPERDPYLARTVDGPKAQVRAGLAYYGYALYSRLGNDAEARSYLASYQRLLQATSP
jgi:spermidine synthase